MALFVLDKIRKALHRSTESLPAASGFDSNGLHELEAKPEVEIAIPQTTPELKEVSQMTQMQPPSTSAGENRQSSSLVITTYEKKKVRRQITSEFQTLIVAGSQCTINQVANFIAKYQISLDLMREALSPYKHSTDLPAIMVWEYLAEGAQDKLDRVMLEQRLREETRTRLEEKVSPTIVLAIDCDEAGPRFDITTANKVRTCVEQMLDRSAPSFEIMCATEFVRLGDYNLHLVFSVGVTLERILRLVPNVDDFKIDEFPEIVNATLIDSDQAITLDTLQAYWAEIPQNNFFESFSHFSQILATAYHLGYWKTSWVQALFDEWKGELELFRGGGDSSSLEDISVNRVLEMPKPYGPRVLLLSESLKRMRTSLNMVKMNLAQTTIEQNTLSDVPVKLPKLLAEAQNPRQKNAREMAEQFLLWAKGHTDKSRESLLRLCLTLFCFHNGRYHFEDKGKPADARPYLLVFFLLYGQLTAPLQKELITQFHFALRLYFRSYTIPILLVNGKVSADKFYTDLYTVLSRPEHRLYEVGLSLTSLAPAYQSFVLDLINRIKTHSDLRPQLKTLENALLEPRVLRNEPFHCISLLARIDPLAVSTAISRQNLSSLKPDEKRLIAIALLRFLNTQPAFREDVLKNFAVYATADTIVTLSFTFFVEPLFLDASGNERQLKAELMAAALGLQSGNQITAYFIAQISELTNLFDRSSRSTDPNIKGEYGYNILDKIRLIRRFMVDNSRANLKLKDILVRFFNSIGTYVTDQQSKLIVDTTLEIALLRTRIVHLPSSTRITVEIRNIGEGIADDIELRLTPIKGKYDVEERYSSQRIENLVRKTIIQRDIFLHPLVGANQSIDLDLTLHYHTLRGENKLAELPNDNHSVWLYAESEFSPVEQPYIISAPATTWFYGRQDLLHGMADGLRGGVSRTEQSTSLIIYGLRRAGKTSVVKRFMEYTLQEKNLDQVYIPIYIDFNDYAPEKFQTDAAFLYLLIEQICLAMAKQKPLVAMPFDWVHDATDFELNPFETFQIWLNKLLDLFPQQRILMVLDEFSILRSYLGKFGGSRTLSPHVFSFLSNTIQKSRRLTFFFTGTYVLLEMMREHAYDLAKICTPRLISFLDDEAARHLVIKPVAREDNTSGRGYLDYDLRAVDRIVAVTNNHPYLIQYFCYHLVNRMNETIKHPRVNLNDVNAIIADIISKPAYETCMLALWNELNEYQQKVLSAIADLSDLNSIMQENASFRENPSIQDGVPVQKIYDLLDSARATIMMDDVLMICKSLTDAELLKRLSDEESYRITVPLYEAWLKRNKPIITPNKIESTK
jgi:hypothetical protein